MLAWFGDLAKAVFSLGYPGMVIALFVEGSGMPFPGDAALALYGFAAAKSQFAWPLVFAFCTLGYMVGAVAAYASSRMIASSVRGHIADYRVARFAGFSPRSFNRTTQLMHKYGPWMLILGRFLPGVRSVCSYVAGLTRMRFGPFLLYTLVGSTIWCGTWIALGYILEDNVKLVLGAARGSMVYVTIGVALAAIVYAFYRGRRSA